MQHHTLRFGQVDPCLVSDAGFVSFDMRTKRNANSLDFGAISQSITISAPEE
ncbi:hypothetical protein [Candidatus Puniceispirillum sp.]|uniref:hypothetical protein n=1 Tax=Candidatus Puniceispirillum sp. TaxID=2026719 RepID=UPI003F69A45B